MFQSSEQQEKTEELNKSVADRLKHFEHHQQSGKATVLVKQPSMSENRSTKPSRIPTTRATKSPTQPVAVQQGRLSSESDHQTIPDAATTNNINPSKRDQESRTNSTSGSTDHSIISNVDNDNAADNSTDSGNSSGVRHLSKMFERCGNGADTGPTMGSVTSSGTTPPAGGLTKPPWAAIV